MKHTELCIVHILHMFLKCKGVGVSRLIRRTPKLNREFQTAMSAIILKLANQIGMIVTFKTILHVTAAFLFFFLYLYCVCGNEGDDAPLAERIVHKAQGS